MAKIRVYNLGALQLKVSPFLHQEGELIRCLNFEKNMIGGLKKRPGYAKFLGTPDNSPIDDLWSWRQNDSTTFYVYRNSGGVVHYSTDGTGAWTACTNGTMTDTAHIGHAVVDNVMIMGDGTAATRHSTDGVAFTNTTNAPLAKYFQEYKTRVWAATGTAVTGTAVDLIFSTIADATDWTTDSSSIAMPRSGLINSLSKVANNLVATTDAGEMFKYDGFSLIDISTDKGPTSSLSVAKVEDFAFYLNRSGYFGYGGNRPELISNSIESQIYNDAGNGIIGTTFDNAPAETHKFDYYCSVGTVTDDLTDVTIADCIQKYDLQHNEWVDYKFAKRPTAFHSFRDMDGNDQLIFGEAGGQCYQLGGTDLNDDGSTIEAVAEGVIHFGVPELDKKFNYIWAFTNPGAQAKIQVAITDTFTKGKKDWIDLKQLNDGVMEAKFPEGRGKLLNWKVYEASRDARFHFYGFSVDADIIERK